MRAEGPSTLLLVILCATSSAGCGGAEEASPLEVVQGPHRQRGGACAGVVLQATGAKLPGDGSDGHVVLAAGALTFTVPAQIAATHGVANGVAAFTFARRGASAATCAYAGDGTTRYRFVGCRAWAGPPTSPITSGSTAVADEFALHLLGGRRDAGETTIRLELPGPAIDDDEVCTADSCDEATGVAHVRIDSSFCRGKASFLDRTLAGLGGNGRACADCHIPAGGFQLSPAAAMGRFVQMNATGIDDPLFRPIDADDLRTEGAAAHDYTNLTELGLVRVTLPLPPNVKLLDCGAAIPCPASARPTAETVADVWRAVPSVLDVALTGPDGAQPGWPRGPNPRGGYQLDARLATLQDQALSALLGHAEITTLPPAGFLDDVAAFQLQQFSAPGTALLAEALSAGTSPSPDPDPALTPLETAGKAVFTRSCAQCHGDAAGHPSTTTPIVQGTPGTPTALVRYHDVLTACPRPVDNVTPPRFSFAPCSAAQLENVRTYEITNSGVAPGGTACGGAPPQPPCVTRVTTSDPGRLLLTGFPAPGGPGDIQHLDIPNLRGISRTAPYFSNNTAATLEEMLEHYKQFFKRVQVQNPAAPLLTTQPGVVPPVIDRPFTDGEVEALLAYLRKI